MDGISSGGIVVLKKGSQQLPIGYERVNLGCEKIEIWEKRAETDFYDGRRKWEINDVYKTSR